MDRYEIIGGTPLSGTVTISGAKNAAVAILPAALLVAGKCRVENVPDKDEVKEIPYCGATVLENGERYFIVDLSNSDTKNNVKQI